MLKNYYKKYNFLTDNSARKAFLKRNLQIQKKLCTMYESRLRNFEEKKDYYDQVEGLSQEEIEKRQREKDSELEYLDRDEEMYYDLMQEITKIESALVPNDERTPDDISQEEEIDDTYFYVTYKNMQRKLVKKLKEFTISQDSQDSQEINFEEQDKIEAELADLNKMYNFFVTKSTREQYDVALEQQRLDELRKQEEYIREHGSEEYVKSVLGEDFNPDRSDIRVDTEDQHSKSMLDKKTHKSIVWSVDLYPEPEELFIGKSEYPNAAILNSDIYAYRHGTFEYYTHFNEDGKPTFSDSLGEIIGITKVDKDGKAHTSFVVAPLREGMQFKALTLSEIDELRAKGIPVKEVYTPEELKLQEKIVSDVRREESEKTKSKGAKILHRPKPGVLERAQSMIGSITDGISRMLEDDDFEDEFVDEDIPSEKKSYLGRTPEVPGKVISFEKYVAQKHKSENKEETKRLALIMQGTKKSFSKEDSDFIADVYFSDYLIENALENNGGYLGDFYKDNGTPTISYSKLGEDDRIRACKFAMSNPGYLKREKIGSQEPAKYESISSLEKLMDGLRLSQTIKMDSVSKKMGKAKTSKTGTIKDEGYPDFDD